jgi:hypothetical protein
MAVIHITVEVPVLNSSNGNTVSWFSYEPVVILNDVNPRPAPIASGGFVSGQFSPQPTEAQASGKITTFNVDMLRTGYSDREGDQREATFTWRNCWFLLDIKAGTAADMASYRSVWMAAHREKPGNYIVVPNSDGPGTIY